MNTNFMRVLLLERIDLVFIRIDFGVKARSYLLLLHINTHTIMPLQVDICDFNLITVSACVCV